MQTLIIHGTFLDNIGAVFEVLHDESHFGAALLYLFIMIGALTIMNMLIGVQCEVITCVAKEEKEIICINHVKGKMLRAFAECDTNGDNMMSSAEFHTILNNRDALLALEELGVDIYA